MAYINLNNGQGQDMTAAEAMPIIAERNMWDTVVMMMDEDTRDRVHNELAPCSELDFLARYLELATDNLIMG